MSRWTGILCFYCGCNTIKGRKTGTIAQNTLTRDHVVPKAINKVPGRTVPCCLKCNHAKGHMTLEEYRLLLMFRAGLARIEVRVLFPGEVKKK